MFDTHYEFRIPQDYLYSVYDYTPATQNREHKHSDIEEGIKEYTFNWECIDTDTERRRGSDKLYLAEDKYYIWSSRTGMEKAGNSVQFSENTPKELRFSVLKALFENVSERKFGEIKQGLQKKEIGGSLSARSPKAVVLEEKLTTDELNDYFDDMAELAVDLISRYHMVESIEDLERVIEWYSDARKQLFRDYIDFEPTILSQAVNELESKNNWMVPKNVDKGNSFTIFMHESFGEINSTFVEDVIQIEEMNQTVKLIHSEDNSEKILEKEKYETVEELKHYLKKFMEFTPSNYVD